MPASAERYVSSIFCDDIRQELGAKHSLMGCYAFDLNIPAPAPTMLPKLCCMVRAYTPFDRPFTRLVVRVFVDDALLAEIDADPPDRDVIPLASDGQPPRQMVATANVSFVPFAVEGPMTLRIEVETESEILEGGRLLIRFTPPGAEQRSE